jgi:hypothetical protein
MVELVIYDQWNISLSLSDRILSARTTFLGPYFMEIMVCSVWNISKLRNDVIFREILASLVHWKNELPK